MKLIWQINKRQRQKKKRNKRKRKSRRDRKIRMTEGTKSWLFGYHNIFHSIFVYIAWIKLYKKIPNLMETFCIFIQDIGYCGMDYISNKSHEGHEILGAKIACRLFGQKAYDLCVGHRKFGEKLEIPDEYSHFLMPIQIVEIQRKFENSETLMDSIEWKIYNKNRWTKRMNGIVLEGQFKDVFTH